MTARIFVLLLAILPAAVEAAELRTWTDHTGKLQVEAELVGFQPGKVWLRRDDEQVFEIALGELSEADRQYVARVVQQREAAVPVDRSEAAGRIAYAAPRRLAELANARISESSGLAASTRTPGLFWTHNDSGDEPRLYLFDKNGRDLGFCDLVDVFAYDWEDLVSFRADGKHYLLICDVGNNGRAAAVQMLHLIEEPECDPERGLDALQATVLRTIFFSYEDDHRDCEAVAVDPSDKTILFVSKERDVECTVYALPWPEEIPDKAFVARPIARLKVPPVTALDVSPDGRRAVLGTYLNAYEFARGENEPWAEAFARLPRQVNLPQRRQGESICYGADGKTLYLTSEKRPTPLWEVPAAMGSGS